MFEQQDFTSIFRSYSAQLELSISVLNWKESVFSHQSLHIISHRNFYISIVPSLHWYGITSSSLFREFRYGENYGSILKLFETLDFDLSWECHSIDDLSHRYEIDQKKINLPTNKLRILYKQAIKFSLLSLLT